MAGYAFESTVCSYCVGWGVKLYSLPAFLQPHCLCWCRADCFGPLVPVVSGRVCVPTVAGRRTISQLHASVSWVIRSLLTHSIKTHIFSIHRHRRLSPTPVRAWVCDNSGLSYTVKMLRAFVTGWSSSSSSRACPILERSRYRVVRPV